MRRFNVSITTAELGRMMADAGLRDDAARNLALDLLPISPNGLATVMTSYHDRKMEIIEEITDANYPAVEGDDEPV